MAAVHIIDIEVRLSPGLRALAAACDIVEYLTDGGPADYDTDLQELIDEFSRLAAECRRALLERQERRGL